MHNWQSKRGLVSLNGWHCLFAVILMLAGNASTAADSPIRSADVTYDGDTYVVNAVMFAPVAPTLAWDVLTDFDHMAQWVPNLAESKVLHRDGDSLTFEQHGVARFGLLSVPYSAERKADLKPQVAIKTVQIQGNMRRVESTMMLEPEGTGTRLTYHLELAPSALASAILSKHFVEHEFTEQFTAIIGEMTRRAK